MRSLLFIFSTFILFSCSKENIDDNPTWSNEIIKSGNINFNNPQNGQKSYYLKYYYNCEDPSDNIYTGDTLVLALTTKNNEYYFKEYNTLGSPNTIPVAEYLVKFQNDMVEIKDRSHSQLFNFYGSDFIKLLPPEREHITQNTCNFDIGDTTFEGDKIGVVETVNIEGIQQHSKLIVSCEPVFEVFGYLIYDSHQLMMSHRYWAESWWTDPDVILSETSEGYMLIN